MTAWLERLFDLAINRSAPRDDRERRSRSIVRGTVSAMAARGVGALSGIITVPLTVGYLGPERYGAWMTISSVLAFLTFTDLGLAASLTNALGKAFGEDDRSRARAYVSTAVIALSLIGLILVAAVVIFAQPIAKLVFPQIGTDLMQREIVPALVLSLVLFAVSFPLMVTNRVMAAYQETASANLWIMASSLAYIAGILLVIWYQGSLPWLVLGSGGSGLLVTLISTVWLFRWHKPWLTPSFFGLDAKFLRELFSTGWKFFIISVGWMINSQTDNIVIAHYLGAASVTPYSVTFRLFAYATLIQGLAFPALWPAYTEAAARKDYAWIRGIYRKNLKWSLLLAICILGLLTIFGQTLIRIWAGPVAVPPFSVILWMAIWNLMLAHLYVPGCLLTATGNITGMTIYGTVTAILNLVMSILLVKTFGTAGVIAATVIAYAVASYIPTILEAQRVLRRLELGLTE